jgi:CheY-like chemotaxis protein
VNLDSGNLLNVNVEQEVILLAEDDADHVLLFRKACKEAQIVNPLHVVTNGDEVIHYLQGTGKYANRCEYPLPVLLLLDLKMPKRNGFEVLEWIRQQPGLVRSRVIVLTVSGQIKDINRAYELGANSFLMKPVNFVELVEEMKAIKSYWLKLNKAPEIFRPRKLKHNWE